MTKVLVAFGQDGTTGDSSFGPESYGEYVEGMTFTRCREVWAKGVMADWNVDTNEYTIDDFIAEEFFEEPVGFWVVDKKMHDVIVNAGDPPMNDSAVYAMVHTMKCQLEYASNLTIRPL